MVFPNMIFSEKERQTDRQTDRQRETDRERQTETDRESAVDKTRKQRQHEEKSIKMWALIFHVLNVRQTCILST